MALKGKRVVKRRLRLIERNVAEAIAEEMDEIAKDLLRESRDVAPQLTGEMIATADWDKDDGRYRFRRSVYYTVSYAIYQHEGSFNPGPITRTKPGAGRKFLQRPYEAKKDEMVKRVGRAVEGALRISLR